MYIHVGINVLLKRADVTNIFYMQDKVGMETFTKSIISPRRESAKLVPVSTLLFVNPWGGIVGGGECTISWNSLSNAIMLNIDQNTQSTLEMHILIQYRFKFIHTMAINPLWEYLKSYDEIRTCM